MSLLGCHPDTYCCLNILVPCDSFQSVSMASGSDPSLGHTDIGLQYWTCHLFLGLSAVQEGPQLPPDKCPRASQLSCLGSMWLLFRIAFQFYGILVFNTALPAFNSKKVHLTAVASTSVHLPAIHCGLSVVYTPRTTGTGRVENVSIIFITLLGKEFILRSTL